MTQAKEVGDYTWKVIPGRKVSHALGPALEGRHGTLCGQTKGYRMDEFLDPKKSTLECEQCLIALVTGIQRSFWKMMVGHVPLSVKIKVRKKWREYLRFQKGLSDGGSKSNLNLGPLFKSLPLPAGKTTQSP